MTSAVGIFGKAQLEHIGIRAKGGRVVDGDRSRVAPIVKTRRVATYNSEAKYVEFPRYATNTVSVHDGKIVVLCKKYKKSGWYVSLGPDIIFMPIIKIFTATTAAISRAGKHVTFVLPVSDVRRMELCRHGGDDIVRIDGDNEMILVRGDTAELEQLANEIGRQRRPERPGPDHTTSVFSSPVWTFD